MSLFRYSLSRVIVNLYDSMACNHHVVLGPAAENQDDRTLVSESIRLFTTTYQIRALT